LNEELSAAVALALDSFLELRNCVCESFEKVVFKTVPLEVVADSLVVAELVSPMAFRVDDEKFELSPSNELAAAVALEVNVKFIVEPAVDSVTPAAVTVLELVALDPSATVVLVDEVVELVVVALLLARAVLTNSMVELLEIEEIASDPSKLLLDPWLSNNVPSEFMELIDELV
jgi:hypothetical protein